MSRTGNRRRAFTLLELTLVAIIVLVLAGLSMPLFKRTFSDLIMKDAAFTITKMINYAQERAIVDRRYYKIAFDFQNRKYQLFEYGALIDPPAYVQAAGRYGRPITLPKGLAFEGKKPEIIFYPDGRCDEADLRISDTSGAAYTIAVKGFASRCEVREVRSAG